MTYGSLFTGIGGIDLGLDRAGMECRWQVEIDPFCRRVLEKHWPEVPRYEDIRKLDGSELDPVDLVAGGFPCQDLSQAGKRAGIEGSRSGLWFDFARIIGVVRPRYVLVENVPGLLDWRAISRVVGELARSGYVGCYLCLRASDFGASHIRKRVFLVAHAGHEQCKLGAAFREAVTGWPDDGVLGPHGSDAASELAHAETERHVRNPRGGRNAQHGTEHACGELADAAPGGWRKLRESSEFGRRQSDGNDAPLDDTSTSDNGRRGVCGEETGTEQNGIGRRRSAGASADVAHAAERMRGELPQPDQRPVSEQSGGRLEHSANDSADDQRLLSDSRDARLPNSQQAELPGTERNPEGRTITELCGAFAPGPADLRWPTILAERPDLAPALESPLRGVADGLSAELAGALANRTKKLKALGNAVVPQCAQWVAERILAFDKNRAY